MTRLSREDALLDAALENPLIAPFAMWTLEIPVEGGHTVPLWSITSNGGNEVDHQREDKRIAKDAHLNRVEAMAARVAAGLPCFEGDECGSCGSHQRALNNPSVCGVCGSMTLAPEWVAPMEDDEDTDEWSRFWGGPSPTEKIAPMMGAE